MSHTANKIRRFTEKSPSLENYWRSIILFGRNVASYKFALGQSLLELSKNRTEVLTLEELAVPFSRHLCAHLAQVSRMTGLPRRGMGR